ncbi:MAG: SMI1/KNR4 family protein [Cyanobacteria bacterium J06639_14]
MMPTDALSNQIAQIRHRLESLRHSSWRQYRHVDGVEEHRLQLGTPVSETYLQTFEQTHSIQLPPDYRAFLATIGEGAPGPYGKILPLKQWAALASHPDHDLATPFPWSPDVTYGQTDIVDLLGDREPYRGLLPIADRRPQDPLVEGFEQAWCTLVITGEARGRVLYVGDTDRPPYFMPDGSFLDWYERWLNELTAGVNVASFNHIRRSSETELVKAFDQSTSPLDRVAILQALPFHQPLTDRTHAVFRAGTKDSDSGVRAAAVERLFLLKKDSTPLILAHLKDEDAAVREAAIKALRCGQQVANTIPELNAALEQEPNAPVFFAIAHALEAVKGIRLASLAKRVDSPNEMVRVYMAYFFDRTDGFEGAAGLEQLLSDTNKTVRVYAVSAFHRRGRRASIAWLTSRLQETTQPAMRSHLEQALAILQAEPPTTLRALRIFLSQLGFWWL